jgi:hypothetical protein
MSLYDDEGYFIGHDEDYVSDDEPIVVDFEYVDDHYKNIYNQALLKQLLYEQQPQYVQQQFNNDIWYNILLKSEGNELFNLCTMNSTMRSLCQNKNIWIDKLKLNNVSTYILEQIPYSSSWLKEYQKIMIANYNTKIVLNKNPITFNINLTREELEHILPYYIIEQMNSISKRRVYIFIKGYTLYYFFYDKVASRYKIKLSPYDLEQIIFKTYYYYPNGLNFM